MTGVRRKKFRKENRKELIEKRRQEKKETFDSLTQKMFACSLIKALLSRINVNQGTSEEVLYCWECGIRCTKDYEIRDDEDEKQYVCVQCYGDYFGLT